MTLHVQFMSLISMVIGGFYLGMAIDTFRRFSTYWERNIFFKYSLEICFWLMQSLILFYVLFRVNDGEIRFYIFLSCLLGFATYQALAAFIYKQLLEGVIRIVRSIYRFFKRLIEVLIIIPVKWLVTTLFMVVLWVVQLIFTILFWILEMLFFPLGALINHIYQRLPKKVHRYLYKYAGIYSTIGNIYVKCVQYITFKRR